MMEPIIEENSPLSELTVESTKDALNTDIFPRLCKCSCNSNIYNAFLIANYRPDLRYKPHDWIQYDMKYGLGFLAYITALIQWVSLFTMILAFIVKDSTPSDLEEWSIFPSDAKTLLLWPFFMIGLVTTYKQLAQIWVDIHVLCEWDIRANNINVLFLKYFSEMVLYTVGSFAYYCCLSWYARGVEYLDVILKLLCYQFIFMADECAYLLVKDIVKRQLVPDQCSVFFEGKRKADISRWEMMITITIPFSVSFIVQGIFSRSWATFALGWLSIGLWSFDCLSETFCKKKREIYL